MKTVAIVGRPNVGKSTLFNRLIDQRKAIVGEISGITRDRIYGKVEWGGKYFRLIDTGGLEFDLHDDIKLKIRQQIEFAVTESDLIIFLLDVREGLLPLDEEIARLLRKKGKPIIVAVNKVDNDRFLGGIQQFYKLGIEEVIPFSALHGYRVEELLETIETKLKLIPAEEEGSTEVLRISIVGRPNVGKSTIINAILGEPRMIVDNVPGTTRDAVDIEVSINGEQWVFIDTGGVKKKEKASTPLDYFTMNRALKSIERSDVTVVVCDGWEGMKKQDMVLLRHSQGKGKASVVVFNKWDLVQRSKEEYIRLIEGRIREYKYIPYVFVSALYNKNIPGLINTIQQVAKAYKIRIPTSKIKSGILNHTERFFPDFPRPLIWIKRNSKRKLFHISSSLSQSECYNSRIK